MAKGFRPEPKRYHLTFPDTDLDGLEVTMKSLSVKAYGEMLRAAVIRGLNDEALNANDEVLALFAARLESWNLLDPETGEPVGTDLDSVLAADRAIVGQVVTGWQVALVTVPKTSKSGSPNGEISPSDLEALAASSGPSS